MDRKPPADAKPFGRKLDPLLAPGIDTIRTLGLDAVTDRTRLAKSTLSQMRSHLRTLVRNGVPLVADHIVQNPVAILDRLVDKRGRPLAKAYKRQIAISLKRAFPSQMVTISAYNEPFDQNPQVRETKPGYLIATRMVGEYATHRLNLVSQTGEVTDIAMQDTCLAIAVTLVTSMRISEIHQLRLRHLPLIEQGQPLDIHSKTSNKARTVTLTASLKTLIKVIRHQRPIIEAAANLLPVQTKVDVYRQLHVKTGRMFLSSIGYMSRKIAPLVAEASAFYNRDLRKELKTLGFNPFRKLLTSVLVEGGGHFIAKTFNNHSSLNTTLDNYNIITPQAADDAFRSLQALAGDTLRPLSPVDLTKFGAEYGGEVGSFDGGGDGPFGGGGGNGPFGGGGGSFGGGEASGSGENKPETKFTPKRKAADEQSPPQQPILPGMQPQPQQQPQQQQQYGPPNLHGPLLRLVWEDELQPETYESEELPTEQQPQPGPILPENVVPPRQPQSYETEPSSGPNVLQEIPQDVQQHQWPPHLRRDSTTAAAPESPVIKPNPDPRRKRFREPLDLDESGFVIPRPPVRSSEEPSPTLSPATNRFRWKSPAHSRPPTPENQMEQQQQQLSARLTQELERRRHQSQLQPQSQGTPPMPQMQQQLQQELQPLPQLQQRQQQQQSELQRLTILEKQKELQREQLERSKQRRSKQTQQQLPLQVQPLPQAPPQQPQSPSPRLPQQLRSPSQSPSRRTPQPQQQQQLVQPRQSPSQSPSRRLQQQQWLPGSQSGSPMQSGSPTAAPRREYGPMQSQSQSVGASRAGTPMETRSLEGSRAGTPMETRSAEGSRTGTPVLMEYHEAPATLRRRNGEPPTDDEREVRPSRSRWQPYDVIGNAELSAQRQGRRQQPSPLSQLPPPPEQ